MTDKQRYEEKMVEHWYRNQLSILEDIVHNYETGLAPYKLTVEVFQRNVKYIGRKFIEGYLPERLYMEYVDEAKTSFQHIEDLKKIRENGNKLQGN